MVIRCKAQPDKCIDQHHFTPNQPLLYRFLPTHLVPPGSPYPAQPLVRLSGSIQPDPALSPSIGTVCLSVPTRVWFFFPRYTPHGFRLLMTAQAMPSCLPPKCTKTKRHPPLPPELSTLQLPFCPSYTPGGFGLFWDWTCVSLRSSSQSGQETGGSVVCRAGGRQGGQGRGKALWEKKGNFAEVDNGWQGDFMGA